MIRCPSRAPHAAHPQPTRYGNVFHCPGVETPPDKSWLHTRARHVPAASSPFPPLPARELLLCAAATTIGIALALVCAVLLPDPAGWIVLASTNIALAAVVAVILFRPRRPHRHHPRR